MGQILSAKPLEALSLASWKMTVCIVSPFCPHMAPEIAGASLSFPGVLAIQILMVVLFMYALFN